MRGATTNPWRTDKDVINRPLKVLAVYYFLCVSELLATCRKMPHISGQARDAGTFGGSRWRVAETLARGVEATAALSPQPVKTAPEITAPWPCAPHTVDHESVPGKSANVGDGHCVPARCCNLPGVSVVWSERRSHGRRKAIAQVPRSRERQFVKCGAPDRRSGLRMWGSCRGGAQSAVALPTNPGAGGRDRSPPCNPAMAGGGCRWALMVQW